jgi:ubiquinone/menaquinone biosynthesis C-methylase UbiE
MTWEQAVERLRNDPSNAHISEDAYLGRDLIENVSRFERSNEFKQTLILVETFGQKKPFKDQSILDIGAGNGISSLAFTKKGFKVTALEPDNSAEVGNKAIETLKIQLNATDLNIVDAFGENLPFADNTFNVVYGRQVMHHAHQLEEFVAEAYRVLKPGGLFLTVRDHVVDNEKQKKSFLENHPLHRYYGGENAFSIQEYSQAFKAAGFSIKKILKPSESAINFEPWSIERVVKRYPFVKNNLLLQKFLWKLLMIRLDNMPGRLYSFVAIK